MVVAAEPIVRVAETWLVRARLAQLAHEAAAAECARLRLWLGIPALLLSSFAGSVILAQAPQVLQIVAGAGSLCASILAGLQTFMKVEDRERNHTSSARLFGAIRRELALAISSTEDAQALAAKLEGVKSKYDAASAQAPSVREGIWKQKHRESQGHRPAELPPGVTPGDKRNAGTAQG